MLILLFWSCLLIPSNVVGVNCKYNSTTNQTFFCSGHCCGPAGNECCFDGIAQTFTVIAGVAGMCLLIWGIVCLIRFVNKPEADGKVTPHQTDVSLDPGHHSHSESTAPITRRKKGVQHTEEFSVHHPIMESESDTDARTPSRTASPKPEVKVDTEA